MKKLMVATLAVGSVWIAAAKSPAESRLFEKFTDPQSGAVSYILKKDAAGFNQQHMYFSTKSMTDDGRFIVVAYSADEASGTVTNESQKAFAIIDLEKDAVIRLPSVGR